MGIKFGIIFFWNQMLIDYIENKTHLGEGKKKLNNNKKNETIWYID
jgi:hypothetical protein